CRCNYCRRADRGDRYEGREGDKVRKLTGLGSDEECPECGFDLEGGCQCPKTEHCALCGDPDCRKGCEEQFDRGFEEAKDA
ncbi:MAG: hypothetical protein KGL39_60750, partial [Patescibacteria group bacterium]|nr:hypothetical protein [Patescibacteria group bacterium]